MSGQSLFVSAGDPSGDNAASRILTAILSRRPNLTLFGLGGARLRFLGQRQLADSSDLAVLGFWEVARKYFFFRDLMKRTVAEITRRKPSAILLVDYPGFNLRLAARIRHLDIPIIYYISPQVWAWGGKRIAQMRKNIDLMLSILPFEKEFFDKAGLPCQSVGHYLLDDIPAEFISSPLPNLNRIALLPGSRKQEVARMLTPMLEAAKLMHGSHGSKAVVAGVEGLFDYKSTIGMGSYDNIEIVYNDARRVLHESDLVICASGTATLECGIIGRPMVIMYKTGFLTYQIAKRLITLDSIGLVNLVLGEKVVPELIQNEATAAAIANALTRYRDDDAYQQQVVDRLRTVPDLLGGRGSSERAAKLIEAYL